MYFLEEISQTLLIVSLTGLTITNYYFIKLLKLQIKNEELRNRNLSI